jgi:hypothetical protein
MYLDGQIVFDKTSNRLLAYMGFYEDKASNFFTCFVDSKGNVIKNYNGDIVKDTTHFISSNPELIPSDIQKEVYREAVVISMYQINTDLNRDEFLKELEKLFNKVSELLESGIIQKGK